MSRVRVKVKVKVKYVDEQKPTRGLNNRLYPPHAHYFDCDNDIGTHAMYSNNETSLISRQSLLTVPHISPSTHDDHFPRSPENGPKQLFQLYVSINSSNHLPLQEFPCQSYVPLPLVYRSVPSL